MGAYVTGCAYRPELLWLHVAIKKEGLGDVWFNRSNFVLTDEAGHRYRPESELRVSFGEDAPLFPPRGRFGWADWVSGWMLFDVGGNIRADALTYRDDDQTISVTFVGRHTVEPV